MAIVLGIRERVNHVITPQRRELLGAFIVFLAFLILCLYGIKAWKNLHPGFHPLTFYSIVIQDSSFGFTPGQEITVRNGICNKSNDVLAVNVYVAMQRVDDGDPAVASDSIIDLLGTPTQPQVISLFPGCIGSQPTKLVIPTYTPKGIYYIFMKVDTEKGSKKQQKVLPSEQFQVR